MKVTQLLTTVKNGKEKHEAYIERAGWVPLSSDQMLILRSARDWKSHTSTYSPKHKLISYTEKDIKVNLTK